MTVHLIPIQPIPEHDKLAVRLLNRYRDSLYNDTEVTVASHHAFLAAPERRSEYLWIVQQEDQAVGMVSVYHLDPVHRKCEWGRFLMDDTGHGLGRVVELMVLDFVFLDLGMHKLYCEVLTSNPRVIALHFGHGFRPEAWYRDHVRKAGRYCDVVGLALLNADWLANRDFYAERHGAERGRIQVEGSSPREVLP